MADEADQASVTADATAVLLAGLVDDLDGGFVEMVRSEEKVVYSVALRMTRSPDEAEDLTAESFLRAYRALRGFDRERVLALKPRSWLLTILLNTWRNTVRDASRRPNVIAIADVPDSRAGDHNVEQAVESGESQRELGRLVAKLPASQRIAVVLRHVVGLPIAEVAEALGCPEGTAKSHVSRGLSKLRSLYDGSILPAGERGLVGRRTPR